MEAKLPGEDVEMGMNPELCLSEVLVAAERGKSEREREAGKESKAQA